MNIINRIKSHFFPQKLRNKPNTMAWIQRIEGDSGAEVMNGRPVRVVKFANGFWRVDPPQTWVGTCDTHWTKLGCISFRGVTYTSDGFADDALEPWKDLGDDAQDESLWELPSKPALLALPVREMTQP